MIALIDMWMWGGFQIYHKLDEKLALFFVSCLPNQDIINMLVRHCGPRFFSLPLPGATLLVLDFIHAVNTIANSSDLKEVRG